MKPTAPLPECVTTPRDDIAALQNRIVKAEIARDAWRASGMQEKYLEAFSMVEALELQLDGLRQAARRPGVTP